MSAPPEGDQLQYRMCKKVAQLTKVIFHLNIRNEDADARLAAAEARFEARLAEAAEESALRLKASVAAQDDERRERLRLEAALQDAARQFDKERANAQKILADRERGFSDAVAAANARCLAQVAAAQAEVDSCRNELEKRTAEFTALSSSLAKQASSADSRAAEVTASHAAAQARWEELIRAAQDDVRRAQMDGAATSDQWGARLAQDRADAQRAREDLRQAMQIDS